MVSYYNSLGSMFPGAPSAPAPPSRNQGSNPTPPGATYFNPYAPGANYHPQSANHHSGAFAPGNPYVPQQFTGQTPSDMYFGFENAGSTGHWGQHHPSANAGLNTLPTTEASSTAPASSSSWFGPETWAPPPSPPTCQQQASFDQSASSESPVYSSGSSYQFGSAPPPTPPPAAAEDSPPDVSLPASSLSPPPSSAAPSSAAGGRPQPARSPFQWMKKPPGSSGVLPGIGGGPGGPEKSGRTRTKDKYRVVYTDHQRLELEKEFHYSRYITIRRKAELANNVGLSERQVKIWFQNRRAKERRSIKKSDDPKESGKLSPDSLVGSYPDIPQIPQHQQLPGSALHPMAFNPGAHLPGGPQPHFPPLKYE